MRNNCIKGWLEQPTTKSTIRIVCLLLFKILVYRVQHLKLCRQHLSQAYAQTTGGRVLAQLHAQFVRESRCRTRAAGDRYKLKKRSFWLGERIWEWKNKRGRGSRWKRRGGLKMSIWSMRLSLDSHRIRCCEEKASSPFHLIACSVFLVAAVGTAGDGN